MVKINDTRMRILRLKIADLFEFEGETPSSASPDLAAITPLVLKQFGFLPQPLVVHIEGDEVIIQFPEESGAAQAEAARLGEKAGKRAAEGNYPKAIGILKRVLELQPSLHAARRDLAMAYVEIGDVDNATNHLIEVLRLNPKDTWSWVVLANLYIREKSDPDTGEKFLRRALELEPNDAWALNSLAAVCQERDKPDEALVLFQRAIAANPDFANPYFGEAATYYNTKQPEKAIAALNRLFSRAKMQDIRSRPVFDNARKLFGRLQADLAQRDQSESFKLVQNYKAQMEELSGYPIRIQESDFEDKIGATIQIAWKHGRDYHLIKTRKDFPAELLSHLEMHELTHLKLESEARKVNKNLFFTTTAKTRETAIRSVAGDIRKWEKAGYSEETITKVTLEMVQGLCGFLFNCPLDMVIERHIRSTFPVLHPSQFLSVGLMATEAWQTNSSPEVLKMTPRKIMRASLSLNGAYALFLDDLFQGASAFTAPYRSLESFPFSQRLWTHWQERSGNLGPGDEYRLVDEFADIVGLRDWYEWKPDPGTHEVKEAPPKEGTTNPELLKAKHPAAVFFFLDALKRFDSMTKEQVRNVAFEIALLGQHGLDYASADKKYQLKSLPEEQFSGLHLMCLMYAGFKRVAPEHEVGMDLNDPFLTALQLHKSGEDIHGPE
jgi:Tfp pilus assembly protein PilF